MATLLDHFKNARDIKTFAAGETLVHVGSLDRIMYIVQTGRVEIFFNGAHVETVESGGFVGEQSLIHHRPDPHITAAIAETDVLVAIVNERKFKFLVHEAPTFAFEIMRVQQQRIHRLYRH